MSEMSAHSASKTRARWQVGIVACLIAAIATGLAAYAAAASYESVSGLAAARDVPLAGLYPAGLDGGLFGIIAVDIALTWARQPIGWLRLMARLFAAGTIFANAAAGWPDVVSSGMRIAAPLLFVILTETARAVLLRRNRSEGMAEGIPLTRWLLAPWPTFLLWRRMKLWRVRDYAQAVEMDLSRRHAIVSLGAHYAGKDWRQAAPADLVWMLRNGVRMTEALAKVAELTTTPKTEVPARNSTRKPSKRNTRKRASAPARNRVATNAPESASVTAGTNGTEDGPDIDTEARILSLIEQGHSASRAGIMAGKSDSYGRQVARLARAARKEPAGDERTEGDVT